MITSEQLEELERLEREATPGLPGDVSARWELTAALRNHAKELIAAARELPRISAELGLPPGVGPAEGELHRMQEGYAAALARVKELQLELERSRK